MPELGESIVERAKTQTSQRAEDRDRQHDEETSQYEKNCQHLQLVAISNPVLKLKVVDVCCSHNVN